MPPVQADYRSGLSREQVEERLRTGLDNREVDASSKTVKEIVRENLFTYYNLIFAVLGVLLCIVGSFRNLTFLPVVIINALIGIIQEIRAKRVLDKMNMLGAPRVQAVRDGKLWTVPAAQLVRDDIVVFSAGSQICADGRVVAGEVQVNESLLTGESDEITKKPGDTLISGSFVVSGKCFARLEAVGAASYISRLTLEAKAMKAGEQSEMIRSLNKLLKFVGIALIPIGTLLFVQSFFFNHESFAGSITSMVAAVIGMIPEGLYLLTSVALAVSSIRLARQGVLLHDMKSIETLARVDVLCVDKTGTITENSMAVKEVVPEEGHGDVSLRSALADSCNIFFFETGYQLGITAMNLYCQRFGLGVKTGIEIGESAGVLAGPGSRDVWYQGETLNAAIGQSDNAFTPLQLCTYAATLANNGNRPRATLVSKITDYTRETVKEEIALEIVENVGVSQENLDDVKEGMKAVITEGSARSTLGKYPIEIAGKTGTAQRTSGSDNVTFIGYAPADDPQIAFSVVLDHGSTGTYCQNVVRDILDAYFYDAEVCDDGQIRTATERSEYAQQQAASSSASSESSSSASSQG